MLQADEVTPAAPSPVYIVPSPIPEPKPTAAMVLGVIATGLLFGAVAAIHGQWAYGDWTCALKSCVAVAPVRRRRRSS